MKLAATSCLGLWALLSYGPAQQPDQKVPQTPPRPPGLVQFRSPDGVLHEAFADWITRHSLTGEPIPDKWFRDNKLPLEPYVESQDPDGDGFLNEDEWRYKTNPQDRNSHPPYYTKLFLVARVEAPEGAAQLRDDLGAGTEFVVKTGQTFSLKAEPNVPYKLLKLSPEGATIELPDGKSFLAPSLLNLGDDALSTFARRRKEGATDLLLRMMDAPKESTRSVALDLLGEYARPEVAPIISAKLQQRARGLKRETIEEDFSFASGRDAIAKLTARARGLAPEPNKDYQGAIPGLNRAAKPEEIFRDLPETPGPATPAPPKPAGAPK